MRSSGSVTARVLTAVLLIIYAADLRAQAPKPRGGLLRQLGDIAKKADRLVAQAGGNVRVIEAGVVEGSTAAQARVLGDSGVTRNPPRGKCGVERVCVAGWDLAVRTLRPTTLAIPVGQKIAVVVEIENRGRLMSEASELVLSGGGDEWSRVTIEPLASGEVLRLALRPTANIGDNLNSVRLTAPDLIAQIDPERATSEPEQRRGNNKAVQRIQAVLLSATFERFDVPPTVHGGVPVDVTVQVRNTSPSATMPPSAVEFSGYCGGYNFGDGAFQVPMPSLAPGQSYRVRVAINALDPRCGAGYDTKIAAAVVGQRIDAWQSGERPTVSRRPVMQ